MCVLKVARYDEAIDICLRAITRSNGLDILASKTLLTCYLLNGSSTEVINFIEKSGGLDLHKGRSLDWLYFLKAISLTQRGNNRGAVNVLWDLLESVRDASREENDLTRASGKKGEIVVSKLVENVPSLCLCVLLLWQVSLHCMTAIMRMRWLELYELILMLPVDAEGSAVDPIVDICKTMVLSIQTSPNFLKDRLAIGVDPAVQQSAIWNFISKSFAKKDAQAPVPTAANSEDMEASELDPNDEKMVALQDHFSMLRNRFNSVDKSEELFPSLSRVYPAEFLNRVDGPDISVGDRQSTVVQICEGIRAFVAGDSETAALLLNSTYHLQRQLGLSQLQRYLIDQTLTEAYLRSNQLLKAQQLLAERTCLAPNDAQAWVRLGVVFLGLDDHANAAKAKYNAWQLGIGQGGFGGPT